MSPIDYARLRGEGHEVELPDDIHRVARLERIALVDTANGERLVSEWHDEFKPYIQWQSWNGFDGQQFTYAKDFLMSLGVDMSALTDDAALRSQLFDITGQAFRVHTSSTVGKGDPPRVFINTYVDGVATGTDLQMPLLDDDLGTDNADLPAVGVTQNPVNPADPVPWDEPSF
jgi:hypothetical protein